MSSFSFIISFFSLSIISFSRCSCSFSRFRRLATIYDLKQYLQVRTGIPSNQIRLIFAGVTLGDEYTLDYYDLPEHATLHLLLALRGD